MVRDGHTSGNAGIPVRGDRIEMRRDGAPVRGTVHYADQLQILVKWDDGSSDSLRVGEAPFAIVGTDEDPALAV